MSEKDRGFGSMDPDKQRRAASAGGKAAHRLGVAHEWTPEEARAAGRRGGAAAHRKRREQKEQADAALKG